MDVPITARTLKHMIKEMEMIIKERKMRGKPAKFEEELVEAWRLCLPELQQKVSPLTTGQQMSGTDKVGDNLPLKNKKRGAK